MVSVLIGKTRSKKVSAIATDVRREYNANVPGFCPISTTFNT
jgi:hypothetical protein